MAEGIDHKELSAAAERWHQGVTGISESRQGRSDFRTLSNIPVKPLYTPLDVKDIDYLQEVGFPGEFPFARGTDPLMYRSRLWTMGMYTGLSSAKDTNRRVRQLIDQGQTGFSLAMDLPTQLGFDSDHPLAKGEVGKCGTPFCSLEDMETVLEGLPLAQMGQLRTTANAISGIALAMFKITAEKQGVDPASFSVVLQNDILKEYTVRGAYIFPPEPSVRLAVDVIEYACKVLPDWVPICVCGSHFLGAGGTAVQQTAFALADAMAYIQECLRRGMDIDVFGSRMWLLIDVEGDLFEGVANLRALRRMWAKMMRDRFGAKNPAACTARMLTFPTGRFLTAAQPLNNVARTTISLLAAVLGGAQTIHVPSYDEALGLPTEQAARVALASQQIVAYESGVTNTVDPLGGSYFVESLTNEFEARVVEYLSKIEAMGGALAAIGYMKRELADAAYKRIRAIESGDKVMVGVNRFKVDEGPNVPVFHAHPSSEEMQVERLRQLKSKRSSREVRLALRELADAAKAGANSVPATIRAVSTYATVQEICDVLRDIFGVYSPGTVSS